VELPMTSFNKYINGTDPQTAEETFNYMKGLDPDGGVADHTDPITGQVKAFMVDGDPVTGAGWLDENPADRRFMLTAGPFTFAPGDTQEVFSLEELVAAFSLERVNRANAVFELQKLVWLNGVYIRSLTVPDLTERSVPFLAEAGVIAAENVDRTYLQDAIGLEQERLKNLAEAPSVLDFFFADDVTPEPKLLVAKKQTPADSLSALQRVHEQLALLASWDHEPIEACLRGLAAELGWKAGQLFMPIRVAITGKTATPPLFETMVVLGSERTLTRLAAAIDALAADIAE